VSGGTEEESAAETNEEAVEYSEAIAAESLDEVPADVALEDYYLDENNPTYLDPEDYDEYMEDAEDYYEDLDEWWDDKPVEQEFIDEFDEEYAEWLADEPEPVDILDYADNIEDLTYTEIVANIEINVETYNAEDEFEDIELGGDLSIESDLPVANEIAEEDYEEVYTDEGFAYDNTNGMFGDKNGDQEESDFEVLEEATGVEPEEGYDYDEADNSDNPFSVHVEPETEPTETVEPAGDSSISIEVTTSTATAFLKTKQEPETGATETVVTDAEPETTPAATDSTEPEAAAPATTDDTEETTAD
jgi:hypothetical protein